MKTTLLKLIAVAVCIAAPFRPASTLAQAPPGQPQLAASAAPLLSPDQLQNLVGRIALYPDDLLGLVLPAATTPLDIVKGQRFLEKYKQDKSLKPDPSLPQPVLSLLAYPEVVNLMGNDLDWTQALGQAVLAQQADVLQAIQIFRRKAQDAGNLKTDDKQVVVDQQDAVKIVPAKPEVIYVPQYQPSTVVVQQPVPAVTYSSTAYPSYYYPGATAVAATTGYMVGAATAYGLNWGTGAVYNAPYASQSVLQSAAETELRESVATKLAKLFQLGTNAATKFRFSKPKRAAADSYYQPGATPAVRQWRPISGGGKPEATPAVPQRRLNLRRGQISPQRQQSGQWRSISDGGQSGATPGRGRCATRTASGTGGRATLAGRWRRRSPGRTKSGC